MPRNPEKRPCSVEGCRGWAVRGSNPPLCAPHTPGKTSPETGRSVGAPPDNQNALTHGFYTSTLDPDDLDGLEEAAWDTTLDGEILIIRVALRRLQRLIVTGLTPGPDPRPLDVADYVRFFGLTCRAANTLSRLLRVRHDLPGNDRLQAIFDVALDTLSEQWGVEL